MTKEKFLSNIRDMCTYGGDILVLNEFAKEFFNSNVCIPKGENRHPYADVLHEWVENRTGVLQLRYSGAKDWDNDEDLSFGLMEYRIKPSEPVHEWQWYAMIDGLATIRVLDGKHFFTEEEAVDCAYILHKLENTKRVRQ